ncbi:MAG: cadherin domain-containing protein, partial [Pirellulaceae bacterium]|nr:cadherin domain-containing protein [Pirellulaceae bacterium]
GGTAAGAGNVVGGNSFAGIELNGTGTSNNLIQGNYIGTNSGGSLNLGNGVDGILVTNNASNNTLGGTATGAGNTIAFNARDGVRIESTAGNGNAILGNAIHSNASLGINLVGGSANGFGVTANDTGDGDSGANGLQNFPVITSAGAAVAGLQVQGSLNSTASRTFRIEVFASTAADASGHGEGQRYLGTFNVTTDGSGNISFNQTLASVSVTAGEFISLTATDLTTNNTSEFAAAVAAVIVNTAPAALASNTARRGGLILNDGSGNDTYLIADNGSSIFGGRTQFTLEFQFSLSQANMQHTFLNYAVTGLDNEVYLRTGADGSLSLSVKGTSISSSAVNFNSLVGTGQNTLSVTWNNSTGAWQFFLNGSSFASGTGLQTGATLTSGGVLVLGHDQDSVGGGFQSPQAFKGTLFDARIFNDVRTAQEIASAHGTTLPYNTSGLVANWTFNDLTIAVEITDSVSGNNLTAMHATGVGFVADDPTLSLAVDENALTGTLVGSVYGTDADREARITALLAADPNLRYSGETGKFYKLVNTVVNWTTARDNALATALNGVNGQLVTIGSAAENASVLSLRSLAATDVWLGATDQTSEGAWRWQNGLSDSDEFWNGTSTGYAIDGRYTNWVSSEPTASVAGEDYGRMNASGQWMDSSLNYAYIIEWNADDVLDATHAITYSITSQTVNGAFAINSDTGVITVANGSLLNFESQPTHTMTVRVTDGSGATFDRTFTIALNNVSVEPTNVLPGSQATNEDTSQVFSTANGNAITVTDQNGSTNALLQVSLSVPSGTLTLSQTTGLTFPGGSNGSGGMVIVGTESDINAALNGLTYAPPSNFNGSINLVIETAQAANMQGWYTFEGGTANDQSVGTTQNGTFVGNATTITDPTRGTVLALDGSGDTVSNSSTFGNPTNVNIGGLVNLNNVNGRAEFISLDNRVHIALDETTNGIKGSIQTGASTWQDLTSQRFIAGTGWRH